MRKFHAIYKEKQEKVEKILEEKLLNEFKLVYKALLEKYEVPEFYSLNEETQVAFLGELNSYWTEEEGISEKGKHFVKTKSSILTESSTVLQKKNYLKGKAISIINESLRQSNTKIKIYDVIDEMYKSIKASDLGDLLSPTVILSVILESFASSVREFIGEIQYELTEEDTKKKLNEVGESDYLSFEEVQPGMRGIDYADEPVIIVAKGTRDEMAPLNIGTQADLYDEYVDDAIAEEGDNFVAVTLVDDYDSFDHEKGDTIVYIYGSGVLVPRIQNESTLNERKFSSAQRAKLADKGYALSDGSFPIVNKGDLKNAIKTYGRAKDPKKAKAHIVKRAKALKATNLLPDKWNVVKKMNESPVDLKDYNYDVREELIGILGDTKDSENIAEEILSEYNQLITSNYYNGFSPQSTAEELAKATGIWI